MAEHCAWHLGFGHRTVHRTWPPSKLGRMRTQRNRTTLNRMCWLPATYQLRFVVGTLSGQVAQQLSGHSSKASADYGQGALKTYATHYSCLQTVD
eukprot:3581814-Pleurochrysis_carterae.AAC.2